MILSNQISDFCFLPEERGSCRSYQTKWYYDSREGICKQFVYGGCGSNGNNFNSREECEYRCGDVQGRQNTTFNSTNKYDNVMKFLTDPCSMPQLVGPCNGTVQQYYYDRRADACYEFDYSGCQGNKNRFNDQSECEQKCRRRGPSQQTQAPTQSRRPPPSSSSGLSQACLEPVEAGPCDGEVTAFYYDQTEEKCQAFVYGGCEGNANRYETEEQCERLCGSFRDQGWLLFDHIHSWANEVF